MTLGSLSRPALNGLLAVDKPWGWSSHDVVAAVRRATHTTAVGHAGTLDPLASGVLVVALGPATRVLDAVMDMPKCYIAEIRLGAASATDDAEGPLLARAPLLDVTREHIERALAGFVGNLEQLPPAYAAIKVAGQPAYVAARQGKDVSMAHRRVTIYALAILRMSLPGLTLAVWCAKGTYIRSLARDLGAHLGTGGYLAGLVRASIGPFSLRDSLTIADIAQLASSDSLGDSLYPPETALAGRPVLLACKNAAEDLEHGRSVVVEASTVPPAQTHSWALGPDGRLLALGDWQRRASPPLSSDHDIVAPGVTSEQATIGGESVWHPHKVFAR